MSSKFQRRTSGTEKVLGLALVSDGRLLAITVRSSDIEILQIPPP
jgi:hypothetical protein